MVRIWIEGRAAPKGSRIMATTRDGRSYTRAASKYEAPWIRAVKNATEACMRHHAPIEPPYRVQIDIYVEKAQRPTHDWPSRHDIDKLARSTIDGLVKGGALDDDRNVVELHTTKRYTANGDEPGALALIEHA